MIADLFIVGSLIDIIPFGTTVDNNVIGLNSRPTDDSESWENMGTVVTSNPVMNLKRITTEACQLDGMYRERDLIASTKPQIQFTTDIVKQRGLRMSYGVGTDSQGKLKIWTTNGTIEVWMRLSLTDSLDQGKTIVKGIFPGLLSISTPATNQSGTANPQWMIDAYVPNDLSSWEETEPDPTNP